LIDLGDVFQVAVAIRDDAGELTDPATATLTITLPDLTPVTPAVPLPPAETGILRIDYQTVQAGRHPWRLTTTGPVTAHADMFDVRDALPPLLFSLQDAKEHLNIAPGITTHDEEVRRFLEAVTEVVEHNPEWGVGPVAVRTYTDRVHDYATRALVLRHRPVLAITSVTAVLDGGTDYDPLELDVDEQAGVVIRKGAAGLWFTGGPWDVVYSAGRRQVSSAITHAGRIILQHLWATQRGRESRRPPSASSGDGVEARAAGLTFSVPRRAIELLGGEAQAGGFA
jgi:hypothetical protein